MALYRRKPQKVKAIQIQKDNLQEILDFLNAEMHGTWTGIKIGLCTILDNIDLDISRELPPTYYIIVLNKYRIDTMYESKFEETYDVVEPKIEGEDLSLRKTFSYRFNAGRYGQVEGQFHATQEDVNRMIGRTIDFHEPFGRHSSLSFMALEDNFTFVCDALIKVVGDDPIYNIRCGTCNCCIEDCECGFKLTFDHFKHQGEACP